MNDESIQQGIDPTRYEKLNAFEQQMAVYFPEIFTFLMLGRMKEHGGGGEKHLNVLIDLLIEMNAKGATGTIFIDYNKGHINKIDRREDMLAYKKGQNGF